MAELVQDFFESVRQQLLKQNLELLKVIPVQLPADRSEKLLTLQDILLVLEEPKQSGIQEFIIQVRSLVEPKQKKREIPESEDPVKPEAIHLPNGKLNIPFLMKNADLLFERGEYALARKIYKTVLKSGDSTAIALYRLGCCYESEGKFEQACLRYEDALKIRPIIECYEKLEALLIRLNKKKKVQELKERVRL